MSNLHPTLDDFEGFLRNASRPDRVAANARVVRHLLAGCPACREQLDGMGWGGKRLERLLYLRAERQMDREETASYDYSPAFAGAERSLAAFFAQGRPPEVPAETLWEEISSLSSDEQIQRVGTDRRFANPEFIQRLVDGSWAARYQDPDKILHLAHLACLAAESCTAEEGGSAERLADLKSQGWRQYGNSLRVGGRIREAEAAFNRAQRYCEEGTGDPPLRARLFAQMVSLRIFQRRFDDAIRLADEAARIYRELGQSNPLASVMVQRAVASLYAGDAEEAVRTLNRAIPLIDPQGDPHLLLAACHNLVRCYIDLDRPEQALSLYFDAHDLYHEFRDPLILLRTSWQEGQLLRDLGHLHAAESALLHAREGFGQRELLYEAAQVSLDLASVYVRQGDAAKLEQTVAETVPIFRALGVDREALASLLQLRQMVAHGRQAFELIKLLSTQIEQLSRGAVS